MAGVMRCCCGDSCSCSYQQQLEGCLLDGATTPRHIRAVAQALERLLSSDCVREVELSKVHSMSGDTQVVSLILKRWLVTRSKNEEHDERSTRYFAACFVTVASAPC
jgi:hypothetical protein